MLAILITQHNTVETILTDHPIGHTNIVFQDSGGSLVTGSMAPKCMTFCQEYLVLQDKWSLTAVVSQDRFRCNDNGWSSD